MSWSGACSTRASMTFATSEQGGWPWAQAHHPDSVSANPMPLGLLPMAVCLGSLAQPAGTPPVDLARASEAASSIFRAACGAGTTEKPILESLRGKSAKELEALARSYADHYGELYEEDDPRRTLQGLLDHELSGTDRDEALAHLTGDPAQAVAATLLNATWNAGTDRETLLETLASLDRLKPEERERALEEFQRRREELRAGEQDGFFGTLTSAFSSNEDVEVAGSLGSRRYLEKVLESELGSDDKDAALAYVAGDRGAAAAALADGAIGWLSDDEDAFHGAMEKLGTREERDAFRRTLEARTGRDWEDVIGDLDEGGERDVARCLLDGDQEGARAARLAMAMDGAGTAEDELWKQLGGDATRNAALRETFDAMYGRGAFDDRIDDELGELDQERVRQLIHHGKLDPAFALELAVDGAGTDDELLESTMAGLTRAELDAMFAAHPGLLEDLRGDVSGEDRFKLDLLCEGKAETPEQRLARMEATWEHERGHGATWLGRELTDLFFDDGRALDLQHRRAMALHDEVLAGGATDETLARLEEVGRYHDQDTRNVNAARDSVTNGATMAAAATAGVLVTVASKGALGPVVAKALSALSASQLAAAGAVAAGASSLAARGAIQGGHLTGEEVGTELAGTALSALTAGAAQTGAVNELVKGLAARTFTGEASREALAVAMRGGGQAFVNGAGSALGDEAVWRGPGNGALRFLQTVGTGTLAGAIGSVATSATQNHLRLPRGASPEAAAFLAGTAGGAVGGGLRAGVTAASEGASLDDLALAIARGAGEDAIQTGLENVADARRTRALLAHAGADAGAEHGVGNGTSRQAPSAAQLEEAVAYAARLNERLPEGQRAAIHTDEARPTAYNWRHDRVNLGHDLAPAADLSTVPAVERGNASVSIKGAVAHEMIGHREAYQAGMDAGRRHPTDPKKAHYLEEAQASYRAALLAPGLTNEQRMQLIRDGNERRRDLGARLGGEVYVWTGEPVTNPQVTAVRAALAAALGGQAREEHRIAAVRPAGNPLEPVLPERQSQLDGAPHLEDRRANAGDYLAHLQNRADVKGDLYEHGAPRQVLINDEDLSRRERKALAAQGQAAHPDDASSWNRLARLMAKTPLGLQALIRLSNHAHGDRDIPGQPRLRRGDAGPTGFLPGLVSLIEQTLTLRTGASSGLFGLGFAPENPMLLAAMTAAGARSLEHGGAEVLPFLHHPEEIFLEKAMAHEAANLRVGDGLALELGRMKDDQLRPVMPAETKNAYLETPLAQVAKDGRHRGRVKYNERLRATGQHDDALHERYTEGAAQQELERELAWLQPGGEIYERYRAMWRAHNERRGGAYR